jgi:hypothetical protein
VKDVDNTSLAGVYAKDVLLQTDKLTGLVKTGKGLTVTITSTGIPGQVYAVGVMWYVAVACVDVELISICEILLPAPAEAPLILPTGETAAVQANVVPIIVLLKAMDVLPPEHIDCEEGETVATGI